jgi:hypothetical protein
LVATRKPDASSVNHETQSIDDGYLYLLAILLNAPELAST